jgi:hypothetical protein
MVANFVTVVEKVLGLECDGECEVDVTDRKDGRVAAQDVVQIRIGK